MKNVMQLLRNYHKKRKKRKQLKRQKWSEQLQLSLQKLNQLKKRSNVSSSIHVCGKKILNIVFSVKANLQLKYSDIAERIISMALESVDYSEEKACQILNIVRKEEEEEIVNKPKTIENESQVQPKLLEQPITNNRRLVIFIYFFFCYFII